MKDFIERQIKEMNDELVKRLIFYRRLLNKSTQEISDIAGLPLSEIEKIEKMEYIVSLDSLVRYADSVGAEVRLEVERVISTNAKRPLPIGMTDFCKVVSSFCYVDKTLLIKEILDNNHAVTLFTRPRRFGKTLNMDMLRVFFEVSEEDTSIYFRDKKIWQCGEVYQGYQGKYPVIFLSFKDIKFATWPDSIAYISLLLAAEFNRHLELLESSKCTTFEKKYFAKVAYGEATEVEMTQALLILSRMLKKHYGKQTLVIIDEYDTPIQQGYTQGYYERVITFMRNLLSAGLKDNPCLLYGILTGILRVAKESIFSGLNNLKVNTVLDNQYSECFGFTPQEVRRLAEDYGVPERYEEICCWYDGYRFGEADIFNPWSVIGYFDNECLPQAYWVSTAKNDVIGEMLANVSDEVREELQLLLQGKTVCVTVDTSVTYADIHDSPVSLYSFLVVSGYLKVVNRELINGEYMCELAIPNKELYAVYRKEILNNVIRVIPPSTVKKIHEALYKNNVSEMQRELQRLLMKTVSYNDAASESFYHGFILGLCAMLDGQYDITSNREAGNGRYDIQLMPRSAELPGILMELKAAKSCTAQELKQLAEAALEQIWVKQYDVEMKLKGVGEIYKYGVAFCGKIVEIATRIDK